MDTPSYSQDHLFNSYRQLRTKRQRRRSTLTDCDKQLIALYKRQRQLKHQHRNLPWIPLDPPVVRGWKRSFVLRDDVARSKDAPMYERILVCINEVQYSHRRDFKEKKRSQGRKIHVVRDQQLKRLNKWEWLKCSFTTEEVAHFEVVEEPPSSVLAYRFVFREPWRYVLRVRPNIITQTRQRDEGLEAEIKSISGYLERNNLWTRLHYLLRGGGYKNRWNPDPPKDVFYSARRPFRNVPLHQLLISSED